MRILFDGEPRVDYGQIYVHSSEEFESDLEASFVGQSNELCGAAVPGALFLLTGRSVGDIRLTVELHDAEPPVGEDWEEIVEAPYRPVGVAALVQWAGEKSWPLDLPAPDLRVRYCATGMNATAEDDPTGGAPTVVERYLLQFGRPPSPRTRSCGRPRRARPTGTTTPANSSRHRRADRSVGFVISLSAS